MKKINQLVTVAGFAAALLLSTGNLMAQNDPPAGDTKGGGSRGSRGGRGNFDPAQFQQQMMDRMKERLEVTKDDEWTVLQPLIQKVFDARREVMANGVGRSFGRGGRPPGGDTNSGDQKGRPSFLGDPSAEAQALEKAIESKAPKKELAAALEKFRAAKKDKEAKLKDAQEALRKVLTSRQEAIAVSNGWLD